MFLIVQKNEDTKKKSKDHQTIVMKIFIIHLR